MSAALPERLYGIKELARRAGVASQDFSSWSIEEFPSATRVTVAPARFIDFPRWPEGALSSGIVHGARAGWPFSSLDAKLQELIPYFVVLSASAAPLGPLFRRASEDRFECVTDLPAAALALLARAEEAGAVQRDAHQRFVAQDSLLWRCGALGRPVVDEWGLALEQVLDALCPSRPRRTRRLRVKLSHDVDFTGLPFRLRGTLGHVLRRRRPALALRDLLALALPIRPAYLELVLTLARASLERGIDSAFYWMGADPGRYDSGYNPASPRIVEVMRKLSEWGFEQGVHPGYDTYQNREKLAGEVARVRSAARLDALGGRQHFLRWAPRSWADWEACALAYDSSVGFAERVGFRAGTCHPYRPWLSDERREARLLEIPLLVMDVTLTEYMHLAPAAAQKVVFECLERCRGVGGVFTLLWHNSSLVDPAFGDTYSRVLERLAGFDRFDWESPSSEIY